jgi:hypothetical protein
VYIRKRKRNQNEKWNKKPTSQIMKSNHQEKFQTPTCKMQKRWGAITTTNTKGLDPLTTQSAKEKHINIVKEHVHKRQKRQCEA